MAALLGREPTVDYSISVVSASGEPLVIRNEPLAHDGTPMPTRYWLVGAAACRAVARLESAGGVRQAEAAVDVAAIAEAHAAYAAERDAHVPADHAGPLPSGGVGGTARGVKCLHAHLAHHLATGTDPIGSWTFRRLADEPAVQASP